MIVWARTLLVTYIVDVRSRSVAVNGIYRVTLTTSLLDAMNASLEEWAQAASRGCMGPVLGASVAVVGASTSRTWARGRTDR